LSGVHQSNGYTPNQHARKDQQQAEQLLGQSYLEPALCQLIARLLNLERQQFGGFIKIGFGFVNFQLFLQNRTAPSGAENLILP
jgi:hypothetical protein